LETSPLNYQFGEFTLDIGRGCVLKAGQEIKLRPKVYETLKYLVEHPGRLIGKQELIQAVWADAFVTDDSLVQCTVELRRALDDRAQHLLKTVPRRGYIFSANVVRCRPDAEPVAAPDYFDLPPDQFKAASKTQRRSQDLPIPRTSFVGREHQVAEATELLLRQNLRLLTIS
jgi:DNA-binding winged helix-turn-helix (wHTH) protein